MRFLRSVAGYKLVDKIKNRKELNIYNLNSREKFEPGPGFEPRTSRGPLDVQGSGSNFSLEFKL